jgi:hypothetical protein
MREIEAHSEILVKTVPSCVHAGYNLRGGRIMPASYKIDKARRLVISTASGFLTAADLWGHQRRLVGDSDFDPSCSQIFDCSAVTGIDFNAEDVGALGATTIFSAHSRRSVVVTSDEQYGLFRMFQMIREGHGEYGIRVFRDPKEALRWALPEGEAYSKTA